MAKKFFDIIPPEKKELISEKLDLEKETPKHGRVKGKTKRILLKGLFFCLVFLILIGAVGFVFFSKAKIEIWPETENLNLKETTVINLNKKEADPAGGTIPGEIFTDQKFASEDFPASGKVLKEEKARGIIKIYNASGAPRTLIPSRFVSVEGKLFWSVEKIIIPAGRYEKGKLIPGEADVEVVAAEAGEEYNIEPSTFALPALAGSSSYTIIYGKSFSPMTGGFRGEISRVSQEDLEKAENSLAERLNKESKEFLKTTLPAGFLLLEETVTQEIIENKSSVEVLAEVGSFSFQVRVKSEGIGFKKSDIENFAKHSINLNTPEGKKLQEESLEINHSLGAVDRESGKIILNLEIKAKIYTDIDLNELKKALLGKSFKETKLFLENLNQVTKVEIKSWPFLKKKIPENIEKIEIRTMLR